MPCRIRLNPGLARLPKPDTIAAGQAFACEAAAAGAPVPVDGESEGETFVVRGRVYIRLATVSTQRQRLLLQARRRKMRRFPLADIAVSMALTSLPACRALRRRCQADQPHFADALPSAVPGFARAHAASRGPLPGQPAPLHRDRDPGAGGSSFWSSISQRVSCCGHRLVLARPNLRCSRTVVINLC